MTELRENQSLFVWNPFFLRFIQIITQEFVQKCAKKYANIEEKNAKTFDKICITG